MASIGRIAFAGASAVFESTQALANLNFDFSVVKVEAPPEFHDVGLRLTPHRRETAEDGTLHVTARRLGALFQPLLPDTPELIRCYGLRASEIARTATPDEPLPTGFGIFSHHIGFDGTGLWAGATSGSVAFQVYLLACQIARIWDGPEATSIWFEFVKARRHEINSRLEDKGAIDMSVVWAARQEVTRAQLAEWDASARAWLRIADGVKERQQKQTSIIIGQNPIMVNTKPALYDSVLEAWCSGLKCMEAVLIGSPMVMTSGGMALAMMSWHLYPDLNILGWGTPLIRQKDALVPESGILTIGLERAGQAPLDGLHWSLPLAHLRFYGGSVRRTGEICKEGARLRLEELNMATLGCLLGSWKVTEAQSEQVMTWLVKISGCLSVFFKGDQALQHSWIHILSSSADRFLQSRDFERRTFSLLIKLGRRNSRFLDNPGRPFFGLLDLDRAVSIAKGSEEKVRLLRSQAKRLSLPSGQVIIRYISEVTGEEEFASAIALARGTVKRTSSDEEKTQTGYIRWIRKLPIQKASEESRPGDQNGVKSDVFTGAEGQTTSQLADWHADNASTLNATSIQSEALTLQDPGNGQPMLEQDAPRQHGHQSVYEQQRLRFTNLGESVYAAENEPLVTVAKPGYTMRIVWGEPEASPYNPSDLSSFTPDYDPWFGEMRHYEYWAGDPDLAALFIRLDQSAPDELKRVSFDDLYALAVNDKMDPTRLAAGLFDFIDSCSHQEKAQMNSLTGFATLNYMYKDMTQATIDVRILCKNLSATHWLREARKQKHGDRAPEALEGNDSSGPIVADDHDCSFNFSDELVSSFLASENIPPPRAAAARYHLKRPVSDVVKALAKCLQPQRISVNVTLTACLWAETSFDVMPSVLVNVMAMSSGNSLFVASSLLSDPVGGHGKGIIRHVMGNVGRPGTALLVPPLGIEVPQPDIHDWRVMNHELWDGMTRDSFGNSTLHLSFTGYVQEVNVGSIGAQDQELYMLESVVSLHSRGEWVADLDILRASENRPRLFRQKMREPRSAIQLRNPRPAPGLPDDDSGLGMEGTNEADQPVPECQGTHSSQYNPHRLPLIALENWSEVLLEEERSCIVLADGNWQARLAAMILCIRQGRRVCVLPSFLCWECLEAARSIDSGLEEPTVYIH